MSAVNGDAAEWAPRGRAEGRVEVAVARVLLVGGLVAISLVLAGLIVHLTTHPMIARELDVQRIERSQETGHPPHVFTSIPEIARGLASSPRDPLALIALGLLVLVATPVVGLAVAVVAFLKAGDRLYAIIASVVLALLCVGFLLSGGVG